MVGGYGEIGRAAPRLCPDRRISVLGNRTIAILGLGTMGQTIASGLVRTGALPAGRIRGTARTAADAAAAAEALGIETGTDNATAAAAADLVVLCVKPMNVQRVLDGLESRGGLAHGPLVVSIAAGISTAFVERLVPESVPVMRAMPNTPCLIGKGMTVVSRGSRAVDEHAAAALALFEPLGRVVELEEKHMDTVTGLSASGPAFIYLIIEALADGGVMRGLPRQVATELVAQMTAGAAEMVLATGRHPAALKDDVTTPAGCTIAGILALEDGRIRSVLARGVETASKVASELGR
jgi:pyrroline-5-carboxylate reductase